MLKMKEKIIRLNKFVHNVCGSCFLLATGFFWPSLLAVFIAASDFVSTGVPSLSSNYLLTTRFYSTLSPKASRVNAPAVIQKEPEDYKLDPRWLTGFADGEGSFSLSIVRSKINKIDWAVRPRFQITQHAKDWTQLEAVKKYLGVGRISKERSESLQFRVASLKELEAVINHFDQYPLITQKSADFELWKRVIGLMKSQEHLTPDGLRKIVALKASMNLGLSEKLKMAFPDVVPAERPIVELPQTIDPNWLAGFSSGEGSFLINIFKLN